MQKTIQNIYKVLALINLLAMGSAAYLLHVHYAPSASSVCNISDKLNCEIVNKSIYSQLFGIPVSLLGLLAYGLLFIFSVRGVYKDQKKWVPWAFLFASFCLAFALYLTGIEAFVLKAYCIFCLFQQVLILLEWALLFKLKSLTRSS